jgi:hypothetical protein
LREEGRLTADVVVLGKRGILEPGLLEVVNHEIFRADMKLAPWTQADQEAMSAAGV